MCCSGAGRKVGLVASVVWLSFFGSGVIYGWSALESMLITEGVYFDPNSPTVTAQCDAKCEQKEKLSLIMTVASAVTAGSGIIIGLFLDSLGPRYTAAVAGLLSCSGAVIFAMGWSYVAGYALIAFGGMAVLISSFRVGFVLPKHTSLVMGLVSCMFDTSTGVFVMFKWLNSLDESFSIKSIFLMYAALLFITHVMVFTFWSMNREFDGTKWSSKDAGSDDAADSVIVPENSRSDMTPVREPSERLRATSGERVHTPSMDMTEALLHPDRERGLVPARSSSLIFRRELKYVKVMDKPFTKQLCTPEFWFIYPFCVICMYRSNVFLATVGDFLWSLQANPEPYDSIVEIAVPCGFVAVPVITYLLDYAGFAWSAIATVCLGVLYGAMSIVGFLPLQIATAFTFTCYRALLFSMVAAYVAVIFGPHSVGRVTGILYTTTALFVLGLGDTTLQRIVKNSLNGDWFMVHVVMLSLMLPVAVLSLWIQRRSKEVGPPPSQSKSGGDDWETRSVVSNLSRAPSFSLGDNDMVMALSASHSSMRLLTSPVGEGGIPEHGSP